MGTNKIQFVVFLVKKRESSFPTGSKVNILHLISFLHSLGASSLSSNGPLCQRGPFPIRILVDLSRKYFTNVFDPSLVFLIKNVREIYTEPGESCKVQNIFQRKDYYTIINDKNFNVVENFQRYNFFFF